MQTHALRESLQNIVPALALAAILSGAGPAKAQSVRRTLAPMPEAVTSFGAVTCDGWLYVFGGHKGERHEYSAEQVSGSFFRLNLSEGHPWEHLPPAPPSQGLPLVAYKGEIYRVGGMAARNPEGEKQDLHSFALVQRFNPHDKKWADITPLPAPRSSHDAVVIGDKLYVAGGWSLSGNTAEALWPTNALLLDLAHPESGWREFPQPFRRRALALAALGTRAYCLGGMDSNNKTTLAVDVYDTATSQWSKGPDLPNGRNKGFGCSAIAQDGRLYVNAFQGDLLRLAADGNSWEVVGRLANPRVSHRLVTAGLTQLIALGGEDGEEKRPELELVTPSAKPLVAENEATQTKAAADGHHE
jgi:N-acetylneuraminic acid mutarotase